MLLGIYHIDAAFSRWACLQQRLVEWSSCCFQSLNWTATALTREDPVLLHHHYGAAMILLHQAMVY